MDNRFKRLLFLFFLGSMSFGMLLVQIFSNPLNTEAIRSVRNVGLFFTSAGLLLFSLSGLAKSTQVRP